jgi:hypothetical protein
MNGKPRTSKTPQRETVSAAIPTWKKRLVEAVQAKRGDRFVSATVEHALDELLREHGFQIETAA